MQRLPGKHQHISHFTNFSSLSAGGEIRLEFTRETGALSVLIPGQDSLLHRACLERQRAYLLEWFGKIEGRAWMYANKIFSRTKPKCLFLVTGQTLTNEYYICHEENESSKCEVVLTSKAGVIGALDASANLGYQFERASFSFGYTYCKPASEGESILYSVYFEVFESPRMKHLPWEDGLSARWNLVWEYCHFYDIRAKRIGTSKRQRKKIRTTQSHQRLRKQTWKEVIRRCVPLFPLH